MIRCNNNGSHKGPDVLLGTTLLALLGDHIIDYTPLQFFLISRLLCLVHAFGSDKNFRYESIVLDGIGRPIEICNLQDRLLEVFFITDGRNQLAPTGTICLALFLSPDMF